jgi:hypothetical protein
MPEVELQPAAEPRPKTRRRDRREQFLFGAPEAAGCDTGGATAAVSAAAIMRDHLHWAARARADMDASVHGVCSRDAPATRRLGRWLADDPDPGHPRRISTARAFPQSRGFKVVTTASRNASVGVFSECAYHPETIYLSHFARFREVAEPTGLEIVQALSCACSIFSKCVRCKHLLHWPKNAGEHPEAPSGRKKCHANFRQNFGGSF